MRHTKVALYFMALGENVSGRLYPLFKIENCDQDSETEQLHYSAL